ncbi:MAG: Hsp20/alpha crystallin family protein [Fuerstiella sp.]
MSYTVRGFRDPFAAARTEFERNLGVQTDSRFAQLTVAQDAGGIVVRLDVPGMSSEDISVVVEDGVLEISGERKCVVPEGGQQIFSNRHTGQFRRVLNLHESLDPDSIDAVLADGVLALRVARRPELQPRKISVKPAG